MATRNITDGGSHGDNEAANNQTVAQGSNVGGTINQLATRNRNGGANNQHRSNDEEDGILNNFDRRGRQRRPINPFVPGDGKTVTPKTKSSTDLRWEKAMLAYKKVTGVDYVNPKGQQIDIF